MTETTLVAREQALRETAAPVAMQPATSPELLRISGLSVRIPSRHGEIHALRHVSLEIGEGECLGIVGESGCGKSSLCAAILSLLPANVVVEGSILFQNRDLLSLPARDLARVRGSEIGMVFQDPMSALNPIRRIGAQLADKLIVHKGLSRHAATAEAVRLLDLVSLPAARQQLQAYPHELSGGMCQRVMIAMALSCRPRLLVADEPTTALDVTIQAEILALLRALRGEFAMALILVSHDLGVIAQNADRVAVMYAGRVVEEAETEALIRRPQHPYTDGLIQASPGLEQKAGRLATIPGSVAQARGNEAGCAFAPRCGFARPRCLDQTPTSGTVAGRKVTCHFPLRWHS